MGGVADCYCSPHYLRPKGFLGNRLSFQKKSTELEIDGRNRSRTTIILNNEKLNKARSKVTHQQHELLLFSHLKYVTIAKYICIWTFFYLLVHHFDEDDLVVAMCASTRVTGLELTAPLAKVVREIGSRMNPALHEQEKKYLRITNHEQDLVIQ